MKYSEFNPVTTAPAIARPKAADLPRPRAAIKATVLRRALSRTASRNVTTPFACLDTGLTMNKLVADSTWLHTKFCP